MRFFLVLIYISLCFSSTEMSYPFKTSKEEDIINKVSELLDSAPQSHQDHYNLSKIYYSIGDLDSANEAILKAIEIESGSEEYRKYQENLEKLKNGIKSAQKTYEISIPEDAVKEYNKLIIDFPDSPLPSYDLGLIYLKTSNFEEAVINFNEAISKNPYDKDKYNKSILSISQRLAKSGDAQYKIGEYQDALDLYLESVKYYPSFSAVLYRITNVYQKLNNYEKAASFAKETLIYDGSHYKAMKSLGDIYSKLGDVDKSIDYYNMSINTNPQYYKTYYSLARLLKEKGDVKGAIQNLEKAVMINSRYDKAYTLLGVIYSDNNDFEQSIYNFNRALATDGKNFQLHFRLAEVYNKSGQHLKAKESAKESLRRKRNYGGASFELGYAELYLCNKIAAQDAFEKAKKDKNYRKSANYHLDHLDKLISEACK